MLNLFCRRVEKVIIKYASFTAILINALLTRSFRKFQVRLHLEKTKQENAPCRLNSMHAIKLTIAASVGLITQFSRHPKQNIVLYSSSDSQHTSKKRTTQKAYLKWYARQPSEQKVNLHVRNRARRLSQAKGRIICNLRKLHKQAEKITCIYIMMSIFHLLIRFQGDDHYGFIPVAKELWRSDSLFLA